MPKAIKSLILRLTHFRNYANIIKSLSWGREITAGRVRGREAGERNKKPRKKHLTNPRESDRI